MKIYMCKMDVESFWSPENEAHLPSIQNKKLNNVVNAMEELSYIYGEEEKYCTLTERAMSEEHIRYLNSIGISFRNYILDDKLVNSLKEQSTEFSLETYGVTSQEIQLANDMGFGYNVPSMDVIISVNSKIYSTRMAKELGFAKEAIIVESAAECEKASDKLFKSHGSFMIKEAYGVSGKGNYKVQVERNRMHFCKELFKQEAKGRNVHFIIEPFYEVDVNFSTQFYVTNEGEIRLLSTQQILNNQFSYGGAVSIGNDFKTKLEEEGYFGVMEKVGRRLYKDGYYGHVCVDSMMLTDGTLVPIVEINARRSMSLMKYYLDKRFLKDHYKSILFSVNTEVNTNSNFQKLLKKMNEHGLLYTKECPKGIIPLSANTLFINAMLYKEEKNRGRIYCYGLTEEEPQQLVQEMEELLK